MQDDFKQSVKYGIINLWIFYFIQANPEKFTVLETK